MKKKPDKLAQDVAAAMAAGMSYGKWKALQGIPARAETVKGMPEGWKKCPWCGVIFKPHVNQKYCDIQCQRTAQRAKEKGVSV